MTTSSQPHRRGRPVVVPNSAPVLRRNSPLSSCSSVGNGPSPTRVVYALGATELERGVAHHRLQPFGVLEQLAHDLVDLDGPTVVDLDQHLVLEVERGLHLLAQDALVVEVLYPDADAVHLVGVGGADAAARGADAALAEKPLGHLVEGAVVAGDDVGVRADDQLAGVDTAGFEAVDLLEQHPEVDDDPVADDRRAVRAQDAGRQQVQRVLLALAVLLDDDGVAGVVATVELHDVVDTAAEQVGGLALALVAPLRSDEHDCRHQSAFRLPA